MGEKRRKISGCLCAQFARTQRRRLGRHRQRGRIQRRLQLGIGRAGATVVDRHADYREEDRDQKDKYRQDGATRVLQKTVGMRISADVHDVTNH